MQLQPIKLLLGALLASALLPAQADAACKDNDPTAVFVKGSTPVHQGPGLNYPVRSFLEMGRCMKMGNTSVDKNWVMVSDGDLIGWVATKSLDAESLVAVKTAPVDTKAEVGPVGSGQTRGYVVTIKRARLYAKPGIKPLRKLVKGTKLLALSVTPDGKSVEVRSDRPGETGWVKRSSLDEAPAVIAALPISDGKLATGIIAEGDEEPASEPRTDSPPPPPKVVGAETTETAETEDPPVIQKDVTIEPEPERSGPDVILSFMGLAANPNFGMQSNGAAAIRRYDIGAFSAGLRVEAALDRLGPLRMRLNYGFVPIPGIRTKGTEGPKIFGQQHDARLILGVPIELGALRLVPEVGYALQLFAIDPQLEGGAPAFVSSHMHAGTAGAAAAIALGEVTELSLEAAAVIGQTLEYPLDIGKPGLTYGVLASAGLGFHIGDSAMFMVQYEFRYILADFTGVGTLDPSITSAQLSSLEHGLSLGVGVAL